MEESVVMMETVITRGTTYFHSSAQKTVAIRSPPFHEQPTRALLTCINTRISDGKDQTSIQTEKSWYLSDFSRGTVATDFLTCQNEVHEESG